MTSEAVIRAYVERVKQVNPLINAVVEDRFEAAIQDAKNVDQEVEVAHQYGTLDVLAAQRPLLGVPLTVKESCCVKGYLFVVTPLSLKSLLISIDTYIISLKD